MPSLPSHIQIGHLDFRVLPLPSEEAQDTYGDMGSEDQTIRIAEGLPQHRELEIVIHEVLHACYDAYAVNPRWGEERTVTTLAKALTAILRANPALLRYINEAVQSVPADQAAG